MDFESIKDKAKQRFRDPNNFIFPPDISLDDKRKIISMTNIIAMEVRNGKRTPDGELIPTQITQGGRKRRSGRKSKKFKKNIRRKTKRR